MSKIVVTGGTGYIGSHTIIELLDNTDFEVISIDNNSRSFANTVDRIKEITGTEVKNYCIDLCEYDKVDEVFKQNDDIVGVIHFAAYKSVPESVGEPMMYYENNINSLLNVLKCCDKYGVNNFIFSSSCSIYGNVDKLPVTEDTPVAEPESPYAHTKVIGEGIIKNFVKASKVKAMPLRYFNPVGSHMSGLNGEIGIDRPNNLVPYITQTAAGILEKLTVFGGDYETRDGSCVRDYIHVTDIANAHVLALNYLINTPDSKNYEILNLGTGNGVTVLEAINAFEKVSGQKLNYEVGDRRPGDIAAIYSDSTKAKELIGWECKYGIEEMMDSAWRWQLHLLEEAKNK